MALSQEQVEEFNTNGVVIAKDILGEDDVQPLID